MTLSLLQIWTYRELEILLLFIFNACNVAKQKSFKANEMSSPLSEGLERHEMRTARKMKWDGGEIKGSKKMKGEKENNLF